MAAGGFLARTLGKVLSAFSPNGSLIKNGKKNSCHLTLRTEVPCPYIVLIPSTKGLKIF